MVVFSSTLTRTPSIVTCYHIAALPSFENAVSVVIAAQTAPALLRGFLRGHAAFDMLKVILALLCILFAEVDTRTVVLILRNGRRNIHIHGNQVVESEIIVDVGRRDLARRNRADDGRRAGYAVAAREYARQIGNHAVRQPPRGCRA